MVAGGYKSILQKEFQDNDLIALPGKYQQV